MSGAKVSLIMTAWNAERFIGDALRSVLAQTVVPTEIIVVDDGSTDATASLAEELGATVLRRPHAGIGASRNAGLAASTGELVCFLDADDLWLPHKQEVQLAALRGDVGLDATYCLVDEFLDESAPADVAVRPPKLGVAVAFSGTVMLRRELADRLGPFDTGAVGDWVRWWARARRLGVTEHLVPEVLMRRRIHDDNNSARHHDGGATFLQIVRQHRRARGVDG